MKPGRKPLNLTGMKQEHGMLTARECLGPTLYHGLATYLWRCSCECGGSIDLVTGRFRSEDVKSCGCIPRGFPATYLKEVKEKAIRRDKEVLAMREGGMSLRQIAKKLGLSKQRISQMVKAARRRAAPFSLPGVPEWLANLLGSQEGDSACQ